MNAVEFEELLVAQDKKLLKKNVLPDHKAILDAIRFLYPTTGIMQNLFCNDFMAESVVLISHAFYLYEDGYFDCAFYSLRQSVEIMNSMLLLSEDEVLLEKWKAKGRFPMDKSVKRMLTEKNSAYSEIKTAIPDFFDHYEELLQKANKYIHKQGFDSFYAYYEWNHNNTAEEDRTTLFVELLKNAIGMILIMVIALDPLSLALSDPEVDCCIPFDAMTEPIPIYIFEEFLSPKLIEIIKETNYYRTIKLFFVEQGELNEGTYGVLRQQFFNILLLEEIEAQKNRLSPTELIMFRILQTGIPVTKFYTDYDLLGYSTSHKPTKQISHYNSNQFKEFFDEGEPYNAAWNEMYISVFKINTGHLVIQHNRELNRTEIETIRAILSNGEKEKYQ